MSIQIVWFKRDLRLSDHAPLQLAIKANDPVLLLYILEPMLINAADYDRRHWRFVKQSLDDMNARLAKAQIPQITTLQGNAQDVFAELRRNYDISEVFSHQETGNKLTFDRDLALQDWFSMKNIPWTECQNNGVQRGRINRDHWAKDFNKHMAQPLADIKIQQLQAISPKKSVTEKFDASKFLNEIDENKNFQFGGESTAWKYLRSFVSQRVKDYSKGISKPELSRSTCSRISPYLAWGNISMRQVFHYIQAQKEEVPNKKALYSFRSRLYWHCHFIQKFEMESRYEFENINRAFNSLPRNENREYLQAWKEGQTGYPLIDACMRCVAQTGYLNFRMRAMVVSFLSHNLRLPWQWAAKYLAAQFLDYEPGIHYPQFQMQSCMTGTNTFRIYNCVKQAQDHDPDALFIKKWVKELRNLPADAAIEPWLLTEMECNMYNFEYGKDYPKRLVDHEATARQSRNELAAVMKTDLGKKEAKRILKKHVSLSNRMAHRSNSDQQIKKKIREEPTD